MTLTPELQPELDDRPRARRGVLPVVLALAVVSALGGVAALQPWSEDGEVTAEVAPAAPTWHPPRGTLVGYGQVAIDVPRTWERNYQRCGTPSRDTVLVDVGITLSCRSPRPKNVDSVGVAYGMPTGFAVAETYEIDGLEAQRSATVCEDDDFSRVLICSASVFLPSEDVSFTAESSTDEAKVDEVLGWIRTVPGRVGVPGYARYITQGTAEDYLADIEEAGLVGKIETVRRNGIEGGHILEASPKAGEVVEPGEVVTVTVTAEFESPLDEVSVGLYSQRPDGRNGDGLRDEQVRAGETLRVRPGDLVWAFGEGEGHTVSATARGEALTADERGDTNAERRWKATSRGTSEITLTTTARGRTYVVGVVTVVVR